MTHYQSAYWRFMVGHQKNKLWSEEKCLPSLIMMQNCVSILLL